MHRYNTILPDENMDFWKIKNNDYKIITTWTYDYFIDYRTLSYNYYKCGFITFDNIINDTEGFGYSKVDNWFLTAIFLLRQSIELGLKSLICRVNRTNSDNYTNSRKHHITICFAKYKHNMLGLFDEYNNKYNEEYLEDKEIVWLRKYLVSLENIDRGSDVFRFPFRDEFLKDYRNAFIDVEYTTNNLLQAFMLVKKCIEKGTVDCEYTFDESRRPEFLITTTHGIDNCYLYQPKYDPGFDKKITGYIEVADFLFESDLEIEIKTFPLIFMFRHLIELCLKYVFYINVNAIINRSKKHSHYLIKDLWNTLKTVIYDYCREANQDISKLDLAEKMLIELDNIDRKGDLFRYPTNFSLQYKFKDKEIDLQNVYIYLKSLVNILNGVDSILIDCTEREAEIKAEYESQMSAEYGDYF